MITTLNKIRKHRPCEGGWKKLLRHLGKTQADDEPLSIATVIDSNGLDDALWCLRAVEGCDREIRLFAVWCARQVQHLMTDERSIAALDVAERYANGEATREELVAARAPALAAVWGTARGAARGAALAAWDAVGVTDWAAEFAIRNAAWTAANRYDNDADKAADKAAAKDAARAAQAKELRRVCATFQGEQS